MLTPFNVLHKASGQLFVKLLESQNYMQIFHCVRGLVPLTPVSFKGQLYLAPRVHTAFSSPLGAWRRGREKSLSWRPVEGYAVQGGSCQPHGVSAF